MKYSPETMLVCGLASGAWMTNLLNALSETVSIIFVFLMIFCAYVMIYRDRRNTKS